MINLLIRNSFTRLVFSFVMVFSLISCEDEDSETFENIHSFDKNIELSYEDIVTYAYKEDILSNQPTFTIDGTVYNFSILEILLSDSSELTEGLSNFEINEDTGVVKIKNSNGILISGETYSFNIGVGNVDGIIRNDNSFQLSVNEIPLDYSISTSTYNSNFLENVDVATIGFVDTSTNTDVLDDVTYSLVDPDPGFSIHSTTGVISKTTDATPGSHSISVQISTNVGSKVFEDVLTVTVGEAPTLKYFQHDGVSPLSKVVLSPWTAYTTTVPSLIGMNAVSYEIVLPQELTAGTISANNDGTISISADQNLLVGSDYPIGVIATNSSGISATFNDIFTITVENRWEATDLFNDTFDDDTTGSVDPGNLLYPDFSGYTLGTANSWNKAVIEKAGKPTIRGVRVQNPGTNHHYLVRSVDITVVKALKISFGEQLGYNQGFVDAHKRGLYVGESTSDLNGGIFTLANWTEIMADSDTRWTSSSTWSTRVPNDVGNIMLDLSAISGNTLKIAWYIGGASPAKNGQYAIDYVNAQYAAAFTAEEM